MSDAARILDEYVVVCARQGDRAAVDLLARRWQRRLAAHAWRLLGDVELAKDAAQEGWIEILRGLASLQDERAFPAWAYRIVSRRCARQIRRLAGDRQLHQELAAQAETRAPAASADHGAELNELRKAIRLLPREQRAALALYHFEGLSVAETAVALDVPAGTVKTRLMHARRKLRAILEGDESCVTSTG